MRRLLLEPKIPPFSLGKEVSVTGHRSLRRVGTLVAIGLLAVGLTWSATAASADAKVFVRDTTHRYKVRPDVLKYIFGAGTPFKFTKLKPWNGWGNDKTRARGVLHYNDCDPNCAQGHERKTHTRVRLSHIDTCHGRQVYTHLHYDPRKGHADTWEINCAGYALPLNH